MRDNSPVTGKEHLYDNNANLLSTTDLKGKIKYANADFSDAAGFNLEEMKGQPHNIVRHPDMPPAAFEMLWQCLKSGRSWMGLVKNRCKNGDHYWVDAYATPIQKDGKNVEFQSVRVKPHRDCVDRAEKLYARLKKGSIPSFISKKPLSLLMKVSAAIWLSALLAFVISWLLGSPISSAIAPIIVAVIVQGAFWWLWKPMQHALNEAKAVSDDPLAMHVYTGRNDEAGQILLALKMLSAETGGLVGRISDDSNQLSVQSNELLNSVEQSSNHVVTMHQQTDQVATAINQMSATVQEVASNASSAAMAANEARDEAGESSRLVRQTTESINALAGEVNKSSKVIEQLEQDSDAINTVVDVIRSVAEQTNLLALNAAIEAARAGEQGRGFAVVADEVRTLANRTHKSTAEIADMIEKLQVGARAAVTSMKEAQGQTDQSVERAERAAASIEKIAYSIGTITDMNQQIAAAVEEQSAVAEDINQNISSVSQLTEELSRLTQNNSSVGETVNGLSTSLQQMAGQFFLKRRQQ
ncbi:PAS domain-containing methyl-accepting chemotaxis protein [Motiliproteus sp. MSK22-1]|uniref:methyl-accepting chemotaxis protein n=1 Tax=Motiliproteus sp. MSK22-1 TaxID=1897630 RepID=UPI000975EF79|nr:PAS domain-containing methyl-accepting chemotaxis protein [Motiliproteus sp. MSK22-1]OMH25725.1 hypothetical protein BGP75_24640 [Motiliproteus sp. MSK22-1]